MPGDVVVVDEWGLLDAADVDMILGLAESGVHVKALGDAHQIQPIDGSTDARIVMDLARRHGMPSLEESFRTAAWQDIHDQLRAVAVGDLDPEAVLGRIDVRVADSAIEIAAIAQSSPGAEIVVQSNDLRCQVAEALVRPEMPISWKTGKPNVAMLRDGIAGWAGDQIVVRKNVAGKVSQGEVLGSARLTNGERGRIIQVGQEIVVVRIGGKNITVSREVAREALALGGVQTGDSAQGQTWERAVVVLSGLETREWLYSAATRGKQAPIFVALADGDEAAALLVSGVLAREGIAQTVAEMAKTDATLAASVRRAVGQDGGDAGGFTDFAEALGETAAAAGEAALCHAAAHVLEAAPDWKTEFGAISAQTSPERDRRGNQDPAPNSPSGDLPPHAKPDSAGQAPEKKRRPDLIWGTWDSVPDADPAGLLDDTSSPVGNPATIPAPAAAIGGDSTSVTSPEESVQPPSATKSGATAAAGAREYVRGFYYKNAEGTWCVDQERRSELWRIGVRLQSTPARVSPERWRELFDITKPVQIAPNEWYIPTAELLAEVERERAEAERYAARNRGCYRPSGGAGSGEGSSRGHSGGYAYGRCS